MWLSVQVSRITETLCSEWFMFIFFMISKFVNGQFLSIILLETGFVLNSKMQIQLHYKLTIFSLSLNVGKVKSKNYT